jgi:SnoaL-like protein
MTATVESFIQEYARRYSDHDRDAVTELCLYLFLAIRGGEPIHLPDRDAVSDHFATIIDASRGGGAATWTPAAIDTRRLGEHAAFTTVRWNALDTKGAVVRDTETTYHLLANSDGWRFLSYTNHF